MKFRKKPVVIDAIQFASNSPMEYDEIISFCPTAIYNSDDADYPHWLIPTLEGTMRCNFMDWIIKGISGEFYPCKPDIFEKTYEKVENE